MQNLKIPSWTALWGLALLASSAALAQAPSPDQPPGLQEPPLTPPAFTSQVSHSEVGAILNTWFSNLNRSGQFDGSVLIAHNGHETFAGGYGLANRTGNAAANADTRYPLASLGKVLTATAVAQLEQQGRLHASDTIGQVIPDYPNAVSRTATIDQLLNMRGGIADIFGPAFRDAPKEQFTSNTAYYHFVARQPPLFAPGEREEYCNGCYVVLGEIIAHVSGMSYEDYVRQRILAPTGMTHSGFFRRDHLPENSAVFYGSPRGPGTPLVDVSEFHGIAGSAAGNIYSTTRDLLLFDNALREHRLLNAEFTAQVLHGQPETGRATKRIGFAGGAPGVNSLLQGNGAWTMIVLTNREPPTAERVVRAVFPLLAGPPPPPQ